MKNRSVQIRSHFVFLIACIIVTLLVSNIGRAQTSIVSIKQSFIAGNAGIQNFPSIAVRPWDGNGRPDGMTIVLSYQNVFQGPRTWDLPPLNTTGGDWTWDQTWIALSTDGGQTFTQQSKPIPVGVNNTSFEDRTGSISPKSPTTCDGAGQAVLAYRQNSSHQPELVNAFSSYNDANYYTYEGDDVQAGDNPGVDDPYLVDGGVFVNFSSDDGKDWLTTPVAVDDDCDPELHDGYINFANEFAIRPLIATDAQSGPSRAASNKAYIICTEAAHQTVIGSYSSVMLATINGGSHSVSTPIRVDKQNISSLSALYDEACAVSVVPSTGHVYVLWTQYDDNAKTYTIFLSIYGNNGSTFIRTETVESGLSLPAVPSNYQQLGAPNDPYSPIGYLEGPCFTKGYVDYPAMTISANGSGETVYVSYTAGEGLTNGSSINLISASVSAVEGGSPTWISTSIPSLPAPTTGNTHGWDYQFQPALSPNGCGGAYLLYYSEQILGLSGQQLVPVLFEANGPGCSCTTGPTTLATPTPAFTSYQSSLGTSVGDYISIAYDSVLGVTMPTFTYVNPYTTLHTIVTGTNPFIQFAYDNNPIIGDLGYSNQRRIVATEGVTNTPSNDGIHTTTINDITTTHMVGWYKQSPIVNHGIIWYSERRSTSTTSAASPFITPWTSTLTLNTEALPTVLANSYPAIGTYEMDPGYDGQKAIAVAWFDATSSGGATLEVRMSEYCGSLNISWPTSWYPILNIPVTLSLAANSALPDPVIAPITAPVTTTGTNAFEERYLIGWVISYPVSGGLQYVTVLRGGQTSGTAILSNQNWANNWSDFTPVISSWNPYIVNDRGSTTRLQTGSFVSVTSDESNANWLSGFGTDITPSGTSKHDVVFSYPGGSSSPQGVVWNVRPAYETVVTGSHPLLGEMLDGGGYLHSYNATIINDLVSPATSFARNPSVTITSAGQKQAAWEHTYAGYKTNPDPTDFHGPYIPSVSAIRVAQTDDVNNDWSKVNDIYTEFGNDGTNNITWSWLRNPSLSSFPKNMWTKANDGASAELAFWRENAVNNTTGAELTPPPNDLHERLFWALKNTQPWNAQWNTFGIAPMDDPSGWTPVNGVNSQRSFGEYVNGPEYINTSIMADLNGIHYNDKASPTTYHGLTCALGNGLWGTTPNPYLALTSDIGALKGTFDTAVGAQFYRSETRVIGGSSAMFKWGKVYVEDTSLTLPIREVILQTGQPDSIFASHDATRDSIFQTEWFDWPISAEIKYDRMLLLPAAGTVLSMIDTIMNTQTFYDSVHFDTVLKFDTIPSDSLKFYFTAYDSVMDYDTESYDSITHVYDIDSGWILTPTGLDSSMVYGPSYIDTVLAFDTIPFDSTVVFDAIYDTLPQTFVIDSLLRTDLGFVAEGVSMKYTIQLVHQNGHIDTIEQLDYDPYDNIYIKPLTVTIAHAGLAADTVMLRVVGAMSGLPDADSDVGYDRETAFNTYPTTGDTTIAFETGGGELPPPDTCFSAMGPYSNPSEPLENDVSVLVHYCTSGSTITAQVYTLVGAPVGAPSTFTSDAQPWDRLPINSPALPGAYYILVTVGSYSTSLGYTVY